jgi:kumamolisin
MPNHAEYIPLLGSERRLPQGASRVGPANLNEELTVSVGVRRRPDAPPIPDLARLGAQRPRDRQRVDRSAVIATHGASADDLARVQQFARHHGLRVVESSAPRRVVRLAGTVSQMQHAFQVQLYMYRDARAFYRSREGHVNVPRDLVNIIERVSGLTNRPLARPHVQAHPREVTAFNAVQIGQLYDFPTGTDGSGQCIGIIELGGGYDQADLNSYFQSVELPTPNVISVGVDGAGNNYGDPSGADGEVELDIEVAGSIAPGATIAVYFAPNTEQGFIDAITTATFDTTNNPSVISISWGLSEDSWTAAGLSGMHSAFTAAAQAGITVLAAAGDNGSNDNVGDGLAHCDYPASDPYVVACGGTTLQLRTDGSWGEIVWNKPSYGWATGGGVSDQFPLPPWQEGKMVPPNINNGVSTGRGVPDITGDADPFTGYQVVIDGGPTVEGGTSAVAPLNAGLIALINSALGFNLGFFTPYLYSLYQTDTFVDITLGTNEAPPAPGYSAATGWDACSGLGRIDGNNLLINL